MPLLPPALPFGREAALVLLTLATASYLNMLSARLPPGGKRLVAALPVFAAFLAAPLLYDRATEPASIVIAINFPWLSNMNASKLADAACAPMLPQPKATPARRRHSCFDTVCPRLAALPGAVLGDGAWPAGADTAVGRHLCLPHRRIRDSCRRHLRASGVRPVPPRKASLPSSATPASASALQSSSSKLHVGRVVEQASTRVNVTRPPAVALLPCLQGASAAGAPLQSGPGGPQACAAPGLHLRL